MVDERSKDQGSGFRVQKLCTTHYAFFLLLLPFSPSPRLAYLRHSTCETVIKQDRDVATSISPARGYSMTILVGLFDSVEQAERTIRDFVGGGISRDGISFLMPADKAGPSEDVENAFGLLSDFGTFTIPGIGSVLAAGPLATKLGVQANAAIASLVESGVPEDQAHMLAEALRRGGTLVAIQADNVPVVMAQHFLDSNGAIDLATRGAVWRDEGWQGFDPDIEPYAPEESAERRADMADGPEPAPEENIGTSIGALSGGTVPGGYGAVADELFGIEKRDE